MSRALRLTQLLQVLRRHRRPVAGQAMADELGISLRTLYRDIETLREQGADLRGEAGVGYQLEPGDVLPPLTELDTPCCTPSTDSRCDTTPTSSSNTLPLT